MKYFMGLDLGQSNDFSALAILEQIPQERPGKPEMRERNGRWFDVRPLPPAHYQGRHLQRFPLGTKYPAIVESVGTMLKTRELRGDCELVVDATGVGKPVVDMFTAAGLKPVAVTITGGITANSEGGMWRVPKRILVGTLQALFHGKRLKFAETLPEAPTLVKELLAFQVTVTEAANDTYAGRTGTHDDLVLSVALAAWRAERRGTSGQHSYDPRVRTSYSTPY